MKIESYKANILYNAVSQRYTGELWVNNRLEQKTGSFLSEGLAVARLNKRIESFNAIHGTSIPPYQKDADTNQFKAVPEAKESLPPEESTPAAELKIVNIDTVHKHQPRKRRKPFTPYGLKGYFVDKQGNIRLHLDRKAYAHTIVLNPDMFAMLADMVRATQEQ